MACTVIFQMRGKKVLVLDPQLSGPLALIAQTSLLKVLHATLIQEQSDSLLRTCFVYHS